MALAFETVLRHPARLGFRTVPFASTSLGAEQPLITSELLGQGRDPTAPIKDAVTVDGDVVVPIDVENFGLWLKAAFGQPVTSGDHAQDPYVPSPGPGPCPACSIRDGHAGGCRAMRCTPAAVVDQLSWQMARSGLLTATARLVAQGGEAVGAVSGAGTPTALGLQRFGHFNGSISGMAAPRQCVSRPRSPMPMASTGSRPSATMDASRVPIPAWRPHRRVEVRFAESTLVDQAIAGDLMRARLWLGHSGRSELHVHGACRSFSPPQDRDPRTAGHPGQL